MEGWDVGMWTTTHACGNLGAIRPGPRSPNDEPYSYANIAAPLSPELPPRGAVVLLYIQLVWQVDKQPRRRRRGSSK